MFEANKNVFLDSFFYYRIILCNCSIIIRQFDIGITQIFSLVYVALLNKFAILPNVTWTLKLLHLSENNTGSFMDEYGRANKNGVPWFILFLELCLVNAALSSENSM